MNYQQIVFIRFSHFYMTAKNVDEEEESTDPVAIIKDGVVLDQSREAEKWGVKPGDFARQANRRCPGLLTIEFNPDDYLELYELAWNVFAEVTPLIEPVDFHAGYLDLTGCLPRGHSLVSFLLSLATQMKFQMRLAMQWGAGTDKWMAHLASSENLWIPTEDESFFLERVPIRNLGISEDLNERFRRYGICTVAQLLKVPDSFLQSHLQLSRQEFQHLRTQDRTPVRALFPAAKLEDKEIILWADDADIESALHNLSVRLGHELESRGLQAGVLQLILETQSEDLVREHKLSRPCAGREQLYCLLHDLLPDKQKEPWREIRVALHSLTPRFRPQVNLWQNQHSITEVNHPLQAASERLQKKFGFQVLRSGREYSHEVPPRFAQLICALKGISLP